MPARPVVTTRRTALAVATGLTGLAVGGCTSDSPDDPTDPVSNSVPPVDADQVLVDSVVERLTTALAAASGLGRLKSLERLHLAHLSALGVTETEFAATPNDLRTRGEVLAGEARLQKFLVTASVQAESGSLAKLLATMSAAVAQHLAVLG